jgi:Zn ribbon nucleic-acid-binding protein
MCGATGELSEVESVLVSSEPGDPLPGETHDINNIATTVAFSVQCLRYPATPFHQNIRLIMDLCFPGCSFDDHLRKMWRTNSVLCSARVECGSIPAQIARTCIAEYLTKQLALVPHAVVAALGSKTQGRLRQAGISAFPALHPSCREPNESKLASWQALAELVATNRRTRQSANQMLDRSRG